MASYARMDIAVLACVTCPCCNAPKPLPQRPCVCPSCGVGIPQGIEADSTRYRGPSATQQAQEE